ncbi:YdcF family protein [Oceanithermus sp.]
MRRLLFAALLLLGWALAAEPKQALVLGAAQYNGRPSPVFAARLQAALKLYQSGRISRIIVSGGHGEGDRYSEGEAGCRYLASRGVPRAALLCETKSRSTWENLLYSKPLLDGEPVWLVTDEPHLPRALLLAQKLGVDARGWPVQGRFSEDYLLREKLLYALARLGLTHLP